MVWGIKYYRQGNATIYSVLDESNIRTIRLNNLGESNNLSSFARNSFVLVIQLIAQ